MGYYGFYIGFCATTIIFALWDKETYDNWGRGILITDMVVLLIASILFSYGVI